MNILPKIFVLKHLIFSAPEDVPENDETEEYLLRWSEHNPQLFGCFHQMWLEEHLTDVTLATESKSFEAHKLILSACSPYFRNLFMNNPCRHPIVFLRVSLTNIFSPRQNHKVISVIYLSDNFLFFIC